MSLIPSDFTLSCTQVLPLISRSVWSSLLLLSLSDEVSSELTEGNSVLVNSPNSSSDSLSKVPLLGRPSFLPSFLSQLFKTSAAESPWLKPPLAMLSGFRLSLLSPNAAKSANSSSMAGWPLAVSTLFPFVLLANQSCDSPLFSCSKADPKSAKPAKSPKSESSCSPDLFFTFVKSPSRFDLSLIFSSRALLLLTEAATLSPWYSFDLFASFGKTISSSSSSYVSSKGGGASANTVEKFDPYNSELFTP